MVSPSSLRAGSSSKFIHVDQGNRSADSSLDSDHGVLHASQSAGLIQLRLIQYCAISLATLLKLNKAGRAMAGHKLD